MKCIRCLLQLRSLKQRGQAGAWSESCTAVARVLPCQTSQIQNIQQQGFRHFHNSRSVLKDRPTAPVELVEDKDKYNQKSLVQDDRFDRVAKENKTKATFIQVVDVFVQQDVRRRGHVEFIYAALKKMPEFGVERDITVYNKLLDVFPKEVFIPRNFIQTMFNHYPRQQECGVEVLEQMENYGVMPNVETKVHLIQIFGTKGHPVRKYQRLMYWFPKFKNLNPYPIPHELLDDPVDLAKFSLKRIADDLDSKITVYQMPCTNVTESGEEITLPHIIGTQSPSQMELLAKHNPNRPVFVEGPFPLWLRNKCVHYYILRADPTPPEEMVCCPVPSSEKQPQSKREVLPPKTPMFVSSHHTTLSQSQSSSCEQVEEPYDPERCFDYPLQLDLNLDRDFGDEEDFDIEDLDEGPVFGMCMTDQGDQATLNQWLSGLQETNPMLGRVPALFRLGSGLKELTVNPDSQPGPDQEHVQPETKEQSAAEEVEKEPQRRDRMNQ